MEKLSTTLTPWPSRRSERQACGVVLNNAPFHIAGMIREREARGLRLYRLPSYCPHLNLIEVVWRRLKGFLMPRRFYDSSAELKQAVLHGLRLLGLWRFNVRLEIH